MATRKLTGSKTSIPNSGCRSLAPEYSVREVFHMCNGFIHLPREEKVKQG